MSAQYVYKTCCINSTAQLIREMTDKARQTSLRQIKTNCQDFDNWCREMGYAVGGERGLHIANDYHVSYWRSTYDGEPCYFVNHSLIEYIWTKET